MKTAAIKILSFALISGIMLSAVGCRRTVKIAGNGSDYASEYWITEEVDGENTASGGKTDGKGSTASSKDTGSKPEKKFTPSKNKLTVFFGVKNPTVLITITILRINTCAIFDVNCVICIHSDNCC